MASEESLVKPYLALGETERHFNTIQSGYRVLASTWTLACIGGIGFVLTSEKKIDIPPLDQPTMCVLIALAGSLSILILWLVDIRVHQRLLSMCYSEGRVMEAALRWLPQVRHRTRDEFQGSLNRSISWYYVLMFVFLCAVAILFISLSKGIGIGPTNIGPISMGPIRIDRIGMAATVAVYCLVGCFWVLESVRPDKQPRDDVEKKRIKEFKLARLADRCKRSASPTRRAWRGYRPTTRSRSP